MLKFIKRMRLNRAVKILKRHLATDSEYRLGWESGISDSFFSTETKYIKSNLKKYLNREDRILIADEAAKSFITKLIKQ